MGGPHADRASRLHELDRLGQAAGDTQTPDRESLRESRGRKATPLLLCRRPDGSLQGPRGRPEGEGPVERSLADRAEGLYGLDRIRRKPGDTEEPDRESLRHARGRKAAPLTYLRSAQGRQMDLALLWHPGTALVPRLPRRQPLRQSESLQRRLPPPIPPGRKSKNARRIDIQEKRLQRTPTRRLGKISEPAARGTNAIGQPIDQPGRGLTRVNLASSGMPQSSAALNLPACPSPRSVASPFPARPVEVLDKRENSIGR